MSWKMKILRFLSPGWYALLTDLEKYIEEQKKKGQA